VSDIFGKWFNPFDEKLGQASKIEAIKYTFDYQQKKIDELEKENAEVKTQKEVLARDNGDMRIQIQELRRENKKINGAFHQMKLNAKQLYHLVEKLKESCKINMSDAMNYCDEICRDRETLASVKEQGGG